MQIRIAHHRDKKVEMKMRIDRSALITPVTLRSLCHAVKLSVFPKEFCCPKYFSAMGQVMTTVLGSNSAVAAVPRVSGRVKTWKKFEST